MFQKKELFETGMAEFIHPRLNLAIIPEYIRKYLNITHEEHQVRTSYMNLFLLLHVLVAVGFGLVLLDVLLSRLADTQDDKPALSPR